MEKNNVVYGIFPTRAMVESSVSLLKQNEFRSTDISILFAETSSSKEFAHERSTKAPEGFTTGASSGFVLGGVLGWLSGVGAIAIPAVGPFIAAGPLLALLAGAGIGGTLGGIAGGIIGLGIPEYEAKRYEGLIRGGGILVSVHCDDDDWSEKAERILENCGARDVSATTEAPADVKVDAHNNIYRESA